MGIFDEERGAREYLRDIERHKCQVDAIWSRGSSSLDYLSCLMGLTASFFLSFFL